MPLAMRDKVFITAALTGSGSTQDRSDKVPRSPEQIATAAIDAAKAGAAVVHCHVRDPETGAPDRAVHLYREVVERIRASDTDVVINLTAGMGGDIVFGPTDASLPLSEQGTDMVSAAVLSGGNVRVGLEDNLWLEKGHLATNAELVTRAVTIVEAMGVQVMTPDEVRAELKLTKRALP